LTNPTNIIQFDKVKSIVKEEINERDEYYSNIYRDKEYQNAKTNFGQSNQNLNTIQAFKNGNVYLEEKDRIFRLAINKIPREKEMAAFNMLLKSSNFNFWGFAKHFNFILQPKVFFLLNSRIKLKMKI